MSEKNEVWKAIPGYEGLYEVSDHGRVRSLERYYVRHGYKVKVRARILKAGTLPCGYKSVALHKGGNQKQFMVHRLVYVGFQGPIPLGMEINHKDGKPANNHPLNLEVMTRSQNAKHAYDVLGHRAPHGEKNGQAKFTRLEAMEVKRLAVEGKVSQREIAKRYRISQQTVSDIKNGKRWKYLP